MTRVSTVAEKLFALECSMRGAVCSPPDEDLNGWDFLVEFPTKPFVGQPEDAPPIKTAFVQIKSSVGKSLTTRIKLSNVLKACRQAHPWFIIFFVADQNGNKLATYGIHVWREHMKLGLTAVRKASVEGYKLHRRYLTVVFPETAKIAGNVVDWMQGAVDAVGPRYGEEKLALARKLENEDGFGLATFTVEGKEDDIALAWLGLRTIRTNSFTFTPKRFGIADPKRRTKEGSGVMTITPPPAGKCEITLRGPNSEPALKLLGTVYTYGALDAFEVPGSTARLRLSAPPVELIYSPSQSRTKALLEVDFAVRRPVVEWEIYAQISVWSIKASPNMEIWSNDMFLLKGKATFQQVHSEREAEFLLDVCLALSEFQKRYPLCDIQISIDDMSAALSTLSWFAPLHRRGSLRVEFQLPDLNPANVKSFLYYAITTVGEWTFASICRRIVSEDVIVDGARRITTGSPIFLEMYVFHNAQPSQIERVKQSHAIIVEQMETEEELLDFGDIIVFGKQTITDRDGDTVDAQAADIQIQGGQ